MGSDDSAAAREMAELQPGAHVCLVYESLEEQVAAVAPFFRAGLDAGERCFCVVGSGRTRALLAAMASSGLEVDRAQRSGALVVTGGERADGRDGSAILALLQGGLGSARSDGFTGVRVAADVSCSLDPGAPVDRLVEYEVLAAQRLAAGGARALCQYDRARFDAARIGRAVRAHPHAIVEEHVCANLFYDRDLLAADAGAEGRRLDRMLRQIRRARDADAAHAERDRAEADREHMRELFIGMLGHDLRTPLTAVLAATDLLVRRGGLADSSLGAVSRMRGSAHRMVRMIDQVLAFTQSRSGGGIPLERQPTDLRMICAEVIVELEISNEGRAVFFDVDGDGTGHWDPDRLAQVVSNLVGNAISHGGSGPIKVELRTTDEEVSLSTRNGGAPIPPAMLPFIFDPFRRINHAAPGRPAGLGLGLYIVKQIVLAHGGTISASSSATEGTTFVVTLPRRPAQAAAR
jgi:signal transduction histidine kinase